MTLTEDMNIWYPGIYEGRQGVYAQKVGEVLVNDTIKLVQQRAKEDGEWAIVNGFVGGNELKMRKMMKWVSDETNIWQCLKAIGKEGLTMERTVDWVCRELANGSKWVGGSRD